MKELNVRDLAAIVNKHIKNIKQFEQPLAYEMTPLCLDIHVSVSWGSGMKLGKVEFLLPAGNVCVTSECGKYDLMMKQIAQGIEGLKKYDEVIYIPNLGY